MPRKPAKKKAPSAGRESATAAPKSKPRKRKKVVDAKSVGLSPAECEQPSLARELEPLAARIRDAGGRVLCSYREPLSGGLVVFAALPIDQISPTPFQRELSKTHAQRLSEVIPKVGRFLDPVVAVATKEGFMTPNGMHRLSAMNTLGAKAITALVVPEPEIAYRILALNTEKAHNLRDRALEVIRMAHAMAESPDTAERHESELVLEFEQPALLTLDALVNEAVKKLKESGFTSGYLKPVVVARINPLRFVKAKPGEPVRGDFHKTIGKMMEGARKFDPSKVKASDIALAASMGSSDEG
jgi:ParB family chromosome partitioning protein